MTVKYHCLARVCCRSGLTRIQLRYALMALLVGSSMGPPALAQIVAPAGRTLFNEGVMVRSLLRFDSFETSEGGEDLRRLRNIYAVVWGARPNLSLSLVAPLVRVSRGGISQTGTADASVFARYDVFRRTVPGGYTRLAPEIGVKLPTGGAFGTGSTDAVAGLVFSKVRDPNWWIADAQVTLPGAGDHGIRAGRRRRFDLAYLRRVLPREGLGVPMTLVVLELSGESVDTTTRHGVVDAGTGGDVIYLAPGIEFIASRRLVLEAAVPIPLYRSLRGEQLQPEVSVILGVRWLF